MSRKQVGRVFLWNLKAREVGVVCGCRATSPERHVHGLDVLQMLIDACGTRHGMSRHVFLVLKLDLRCRGRLQVVD